MLKTIAHKFAIAASLDPSLIWTRDNGKTYEIPAGTRGQGSIRFTRHGVDLGLVRHPRFSEFLSIAAQLNANWSRNMKEFTNVTDAIERSSTHSERAKIVADHAEVLEALRGIYGPDVEHCDANNGVVEMWLCDDAGYQWYLEIHPDYDAIMHNAIAAWDADLVSGFVAWCWDYRDETVDALRGGELDQIVDDLVYNATQSSDTPRGISEDLLADSARTMLDSERDDLITALKESIASD